MPPPAQLDEIDASEEKEIDEIGAHNKRNECTPRVSSDDATSCLQQCARHPSPHAHLSGRRTHPRSTLTRPSLAHSPLARPSLAPPGCCEQARARPVAPQERRRQLLARHPNPPATNVYIERDRRRGVKPCSTEHHCRSTRTSTGHACTHHAPCLLSPSPVAFAYAGVNRVRTLILRVLFFTYMHIYLYLFLCFKRENGDYRRIFVFVAPRPTHPSRDRYF